MATIVKDLGAVTAYAYAKEKGYTGTEDEFAELMASYADVAEQAAESAAQAGASATAAEQAKAEAVLSASAAASSASTASTKASEAASSASSAAGSANTATTKANEASTSATNAASSASAAATSATNAGASETAAASSATAASNAQTAAETAQGKAEDAQTAAEDAAASVSASAAQITQNTEDVADLKSAIQHKANVFDSTAISEGCFLRHDIGTTPSITGWSVSDYIDVSNYSKFATGYMKHIGFFRQDKSFITGSGFEVADASQNVITVPTGAYYVRFDWNLAKLAYYNFTEATIQVIPNSDYIDSKYHVYNVPYDYGFDSERYLDFWKGRRILWLGTSIPEGNRRPAYGYPNMLADRLGCTVINNAVGGSMAMSGRQMLVSDSDPNGLYGQNWGWTKGLTQPLSLKNDFINNWATWKTHFTSAPDTLDATVQSMILASSYENALDPYLTDADKCDLYVLNFGWNESTPELYAKDANNNLYCDWTRQYMADNAANIDTLDPYRYNTKTFRGAYNWIIRRILSAQPQASILIIGEGEAAARVNLVTAQEKCAYENACQYIPLWKIMGLNQRLITTSKRVNSAGWWENTAFQGSTQYCRIYDGTHPQGWMTNRIAEYLEAQFRTNIRC